MAFSLGTGNKEAAALKARNIYGDLLSLGIEGTLAKHRAKKPQKGTEIAAIGEWIVEAQKVFDGKPATFGAYVRCLRSIAADIVAVEKQRHSRKRVLNFRRKIDAVSLEVLTPEAVQSWRIRFVKRAGSTPALQRSARISANTFIRQARSLFAERIRRFIGLNLPDPIPFAKAEFFPRESMRYQSKIDPATLLQTAQDKLSNSDPEAFKILILALGAGLRRGEIDRLLWKQIDFNIGLIRVEATEAGDLKSADSTGEVSIDETLNGLLHGFKARATTNYVIEATGEGETNSRAWGHSYRCTPIFERLNGWLRENGVDSPKPLHTLRKESGSIIATQSGIFAASKFLRHADIGVTAAFYADHKARVSVNMGSLLGASSQENVIALPAKTHSPKPHSKTNKRAKAK